jgi:Topoisomerase DNA binding C4 zinc finger
MAVSNLAELKKRVAVLEDLLREAREAVTAIQSRPVAEVTDAAWFEQNYGDCPECDRSLKLVPKGRGRASSDFIGCTGFPNCRFHRSLTPHEADLRNGVKEKHHEEHLAVDHRSTSAANAFDMKEAILFELGLGDGKPITKSKLWDKLTSKGQGGQGYYVFKTMLEEMHAEGKIVLAKENGHGAQADIWRISPVSAVVEVY